MPLSAQADLLPPVLCVAISKRTLKEISVASGIPLRTVTRMATKTSWGLERVDAFAAACGVDLLKQREARAYLRSTVKKNSPFRHLSRRRLATINERLAKA